MPNNKEYGGDVIGWISANCKNRNTCESSSYKTSAQEIPASPIPPKQTKRTDTTSYTYDRYGALQRIVYPNQDTAEFSYNVLGAIDMIKKNNAIAVIGTAYAPTGAIAAIDYANGAA
ncbi:MAG: hypothetical protein HY564_02660 [Candidatus Jacksonbacteria bacterium]|nr:hypothetical protein [Candidatus Jacksonbacteria bacterium]